MVVTKGGNEEDPGSYDTNRAPVIYGPVIDLR
jgi:hypothetical protein